MAEEGESGKTAAPAGNSPSSGAPASPPPETAVSPEPKAVTEEVAAVPSLRSASEPETRTDPALVTMPPPYSPSSPPPKARHPSPAPPQSEWTASDVRGPLAAADDETEGGSVPKADEPEPPLGPPGTEDPRHSDVTSETPAAREPATSATPAATPAAAEPRSSWPIAGGILFGAAIGAIVALLVYRTQTTENGPDQQIATLSAKVDALEQRPDPSAEIETLKRTVATLQKSPAAAPKQAAAAPAPAFDPAPLDQKIAALKASLDAVKQQGAETKSLAGKLDDLDGKLAALQKQAATNESGLQSVQGQQKSLEGKVGAPALAVVADSLVQQIDQGRPYAAQVDALVSLNADPVKIAVLKQYAKTGVPSAKVLAAKFAPLAEPILATGHKAPPDASFTERLKAGLFGLVSIRRADDLSGTDLSSRVARLQASLTHDDLTGALDAWAGLPPDAKAKSEAWGALAKTSADAMTAARGLQADSIAAMGGKKS